MVRCIVKILAFTDRADRVVRPYAPTSEPIRLLNGRDTPFRCAPQRGSSALTGGVAPVTFTARRGEGTPPYEGSRRTCCAHRCGASGPPPLRTGSEEFRRGRRPRRPARQLQGLLLCTSQRQRRRSRDDPFIESKKKILRERVASSYKSVRTIARPEVLKPSDTKKLHPLGWSLFMRIVSSYSVTKGSRAI